MRIFLIVLAAIWHTSAAAQSRPAPPLDPPELYFLSVGIGEYSDGRQLILEEAETSARLVAETLMAAGARYGILLTSRESEGIGGHAVSRADIFQAVFDLKAQIRRDGAVAPRIVFYVMGHGYGDPNLNMLFVQAGESEIAQRHKSQMGTTHLVQTTLWNFDVLSALINFRTHPSMTYMDDFVPSQIMPNLLEPLSGLKTAARAAELQRKEQAVRARNGFAPEGNPPVPYIALFDNCFSEVDQDLVIDAGMVGRLIRSIMDDTVDEGIVFYAAPPGDTRVPVEIPGGGGQKAGPLALRFIEALSAVGPAGTMRALNDAIAADSAWPAAHRVGRPLVADVASLRVRQGGNVSGSLETRFGTWDNAGN